MLLHCSDPPITFDDFRDPPPPHVFIFQAKVSNPSSESFQSFQWFPPFGFSVTTDPPFCSPKNQVIPPGRNNDRSLIHFMNRIAPFDFEHAKDHLILLANPEVMGWNNRCLSLKSLLMSSISLTIIITLCKRLLILVHKEFLHWCVKFKLCFACLLKVLTRLLISCM